MYALTNLYILSLCLLRASSGNTTVHDKAVSGNVIGSLVQGQKLGHGSNLTRLAQATQWNLFLGLFENGWINFGRHGRFDEAGANGVNLEVLVGKLTGTGARERDDTTLGGRIIGLSRVAEHARYTGNVNDPTAGLLFLDGRLEVGLAAEENSTEIDGQDCRPLVGFHT